MIEFEVDMKTRNMIRTKSVRKGYANYDKKITDGQMKAI